MRIKVNNKIKETSEVIFNHDQLFVDVQYQELHHIIFMRYYLSNREISVSIENILVKSGYMDLTGYKSTMISPSIFGTKNNKMEDLK